MRYIQLNKPCMRGQLDRNRMLVHSWYRTFRLVRCCKQQEPLGKDSRCSCFMNQSMLDIWWGHSFCRRCWRRGISRLGIGESTDRLWGTRGHCRWDTDRTWDRSRFSSQSSSSDRCKSVCCNTGWETCSFSGKYWWSIGKWSQSGMSGKRRHWWRKSCTLSCRWGSSRLRQNSWRDRQSGIALRITTLQQDMKGTSHCCMWGTTPYTGHKWHSTSQNTQKDMC